MFFKYKQQQKITKNKFFPLLKTLSLQSDIFKLPPNYHIFPPPEYIVANNYKVNHFKIYNQFSLLQWTQIDLANLKENTLGSLVQLGKDFVEVYKRVDLTPKVGIELNKPCMATFFNGHELMKLVKNSEVLISKLKKKCNELNVQFVNFSIQSGYWSILIPHFTRYSFTNFIDSNQSEEQELSEFQEQSKKSENPIKIKKMDFNQTMIQQEHPIQQIYQEIYTNRIQNYSQKLIDTISQHNLSLKKYNPKFKINLLSFSGNGYIYLFQRSFSSYQIKLLQNPLFDHSFLNQFLNYNIKITVDDTFIFDKLITPRHDQFGEVLNLIHILFNQNIQVNFLNKNKIYNYNNEYFDKQQVLKNWLEYIIQLINLKTKSQIKKFLCKRDIKTLYDTMIFQKNFKCAEIVTRLQDLLFRTFIKKIPENIPLQLKQILTNKINDFCKGQQWLVRLANELWYNLQQDFEVIILQKIEQLQKYPQAGKEIYARLFRSFIYKSTNRLNQKFELREFKDEKQEIIQWLVSNILKQIQIQIYDKKFYAKFRINQVYSLISKIQSFDQKVRLLKYDNFISEDIKNKFQQQIFNRQFDQIKNKSNNFIGIDKLFFNKASIIHQIYNFRTPDALKYLLRDIQSRFFDLKYIQNIAKDLTHIIKHGSFREKIEYYELLKKIQMHSTDTTLVVYQQYLSLWLGKLPLTIKILNDLLLKIEKSGIKIKKQIEVMLLQHIMRNQDYFSQVFKQKENEKTYKQMVQMSKPYQDMNKMMKILILPSL